MITPQETASRVVEAINAKEELSHNQQAMVLILVSQAIEQDRKDVADYYGDPERLLELRKQKQEGEQ